MDGPVHHAWLAQAGFETTFVSAMTIFELEHGVRQMERRDLNQGAALLPLVR